MAYIHGETKAAKEARETEARTRERLAELRKIEAELEARIAHRKQLLRRVPTIRPYKPTEELAAAWENRPNDLPEPQWGGAHGLHLATLEAAAWDQTHRRGKKHS